MKEIILEKESQNKKTSSGILEVIRDHRKKLSIGLGCLTIVSGMLLASGCSKKSDQEDAVKDEISTIIEEADEIETFDPSKCEIEDFHLHLCTWEEMRLYPELGEKLTQFTRWCTDSDIEELKSMDSSLNFKVGDEVDIYSVVEDFDPDKCEIEGEHKHLHIGKHISTIDEGKKEIRVWSWLSDESIKKKRENDPNFEVFNRTQYIIKPETSSKEEVYGNKVFVKR